MMESAFGAAFRHRKRIAKWEKATRVLPRLRHDAWWVLHNVVSHPVLGVWPSATSVWFHDWTSQRLNRRQAFTRSPAPEIERHWAWIKHNVLVHAAIGLFPSPLTFAWHDRSAVEMNVEDWV
jgi:hypothetical protein